MILFLSNEISSRGRMKCQIQGLLVQSISCVNDFSIYVLLRCLPDVVNEGFIGSRKGHIIPPALWWGRAALQYDFRLVKCNENFGAPARTLDIWQKHGFVQLSWPPLSKSQTSSFLWEYWIATLGRSRVLLLLERDSIKTGTELNQY